ncbi:hypothetical protein ACVIHH_005134 [Bradyrhizobium sp. USDA 4518]|nr:hypothetical protein [Bradyrhizobium elkanii]
MGQDDYRSFDLARSPLKPSTSRRRCFQEVGRNEIAPMLGGVDRGPQHSGSIVRESAGGCIKEKPELSAALRLQLERLPKTEAP